LSLSLNTQEMKKNKTKLWIIIYTIKMTCNNEGKDTDSQSTNTFYFLIINYDFKIQLKT